MKKESSALSAIKGVQAPGLEDFEEAAALAELIGDMEEVVKQRGKKWVHYDDETEVELGSYDDRDVAWDRQRQHRTRKRREKELKNKDPQKHGPQIEKKPGIKRNKTEAMQRLKELIRPLIKESVLSYVFEQPQNSEESVVWEKFISQLSRESLMSDKKLKDILVKMQKSEEGILKNAFNLVKRALGEGGFEVDSPSSGRDKDTGRPCVNFNVALTDGSVFPVLIKVQNARPVINLPEQTKHNINALGTEESKMLRAALIHVQETALDLMDDVVKAAEKRDQYLAGLESKIDKVVHNLGPVEIAMLRHLLKLKYRGVK
jgi:hypothetical protein